MARSHQPRSSRPAPCCVQRRDRQRGNSLLLALIVLSALAALGSLTVVSVQSGLKTSTNDRSQTIAMYAAESGGAAAMAFLRDHVDPAAGWSTYATGTPLDPSLLPSNGAQPGTPENPFSVDQQAWYSVAVFNNRNDPHYLAVPIDPVAPIDADGRVILRSTGHGPQGSVAIIEWEVQRLGFASGTTPPPPWPASPFSPRGLVLLGWHVVSL